MSGLGGKGVKARVSQRKDVGKVAGEERGNSKGDCGSQSRG